MRTGAGAAIVIAALALVAAGCGSGGGSSATPLELVAQATSKTAKADSAKFHMAVTETVGPIGPLTITADGASSNATHSARMTMDLTSVAQLAGGDRSGWKGEVIVDGSNPKAVVEYMRLPAFSKLLPGAKEWVKIDVSELSKLRGVDLAQLIQTAGTGQDPTQALQMLQSVGDVKEVGSEQVDGVDTTKYSGTLDPQKLAKKFGSGQFGQIFQQMGTTPIPVAVWVDGDGYVRKLEETMNAKTTAGAMSVKLAVELSDFGTTVDVTPPPAGQTSDISELLKKK
jgi:hypothetical protein